MPDSKITALTALTAADPAVDMFPVVDVSDTTMAASGTTKRISINNILACSPSATLASATITGDLTVDTNVLKVDTTNNRVGIGTASPSVDLHIQSAGSASAEVRLASATRSYNIASTGSGYGSANNLIIYDLTGAAERYRLDASGNHFWNNVGGVAGTAMTLNANGLGIGVTPSAGKGCLQLSSGINFPATQVASADANTLDDYEESTWTPTITSATGTPTTVTVNAANYTKIGRIVVINIDFSVVAIGTAAGSLTFTLPFNHSGSSIPCGAFRENASTGNMGQIFYGSGTTASCLLYNNATPWVNGYRIQGTYTYFSA